MAYSDEMCRWQTMVWTIKPSARLSWKTLLGSLAVVQIFLFALFQRGFIVASKSSTTKDNFVQPLDHTLSSKLTNMESNSWKFGKFNSQPIKFVQNDTQNIDTYENTLKIVDIHIEHDDPHHASEVQGDVHKNFKPHIIPNSIAIGVAVTSHKSKWGNITELIETFPFYHTFLKTFCDTASYNYSYNFFMAYDKTDSFFTHADNLRKFQSIFYDFVAKNCHQYSEYAIHFVQCGHNKHPAWAQNDAMIAAYMSNMEYYYRINDDTNMESKQWTEIFIQTLKGFDPPNIGVVGPTHDRGNMKILTYDFVHYSHIEIFGFYYPRVFGQWYADEWITKVYKPGRCVKIETILLKHTIEKGRRYELKKLKPSFLKPIYAAGKSIMEKYVARIKKYTGITQDSRKVISMSLYGRNPRYAYGAIRNLQLHKVFLADWTIRVYIIAQSTSRKELRVAQPVIDKLYLLGAKIVILNETFESIDPKLWRFLVADDKSVEYFFIRDSDSRLNERVQLLTEDWLKSDTPFFCVRDFKDPGNNTNPIVAGLLGAKNKHFQKALNGSIEKFINTLQLKTSLSNSSVSNVSHVGNQTKTILPQKSSHDIFINDILWPIYQSNAKCYDSYAKSTWTNLQPFPTNITASDSSMLTSSYNEFENIIK